MTDPRGWGAGCGPWGPGWSLSAETDLVCVYSCQTQHNLIFHIKDQIIFQLQLITHPKSTSKGAGFHPGLARQLRMRPDFTPAPWCLTAPRLKPNSEGPSFRPSFDTATLRLLTWFPGPFSSHLLLGLPTKTAVFLRPKKSPLGLCILSGQACTGRRAPMWSAVVR